MKKLSVRIISFILCLSMLISLAACQKDKQTDESPAENFKLSSEYVVLRSEFYKDYEEIVDSLQIVRDAVGAVFGEFPSLGTDRRRAGDETVNEFEILVGNTNREQSQEAIKALGANDYTYSVESKNVIVICGGSPKATLEATKKFCLDLLGYDADTKEVVNKNAVLSTGAKFTHTAEYKYESATLNGIDFNDITVAYNSDRQIAFGYAASNIFSEYTGKPVPVIKYSELKGDEKCVICIGYSDRSGNKNMKPGHLGYLVTNTEENGLASVGIAVSNDDFYNDALTALAKNITSIDDGNSATLSFKLDTLYGFDCEKDFPKWYLETETTEKLADGVLYSERKYVDGEGLPYRVYYLTVDPSKASVYMGSPNDTYDYSIAEGDLQNVQQHIDSAVKNGVNVIAGVNANFFGLNDKGVPHGLSIKEGVLTVTNVGPYTPYFGYTKEGKAVIGSSAIVPTGAVYKTAIAGSHYIVQNGLPKTVDVDKEFGYTPHPRTLAGIKEDGTMVFAVIDGRQQQISNGAPLARCASLMISLGCVDAVNLDGGGSSTMITKIDGKFVTQNRPSDGQLRKVPLSLLIVGK